MINICKKPKIANEFQGFLQIRRTLDQNNDAANNVDAMLETYEQQEDEQDSHASQRKDGDSNSNDSFMSSEFNCRVEDTDEAVPVVAMGPSEDVSDQSNLSSRPANIIIKGIGQGVGH